MWTCNNVYSKQITGVLFFISISDVTSRSVCDSLLWKPWPILFDDKSLINLVMFRNCSKLPEGNVCFESLLCAVLPHVAS